jgi:transcriptional regulator with XRE-family HTH domain
MDPDKFALALADKIRAAKLKSGLSYRQITARGGPSTTAMSRWETCKRMPDVRTLAQFAAVLGVPLGDLVPTLKIKPKEKKAPAE